jgi:hypothetical protein
MTQQPRSSPEKLNTLIHEIEAIPQEHWADLLITLRQFRQQKTHPIINAEQLEKNQGAMVKDRPEVIALLKSWAEEDSAEEDAQAWVILKTNLDIDRLSVSS